MFSANAREREVEQILYSQLRYDFWDKGWPDILVHDSQRCFLFCIEVKSEIDKPSEIQAEVHTLLRAAGVPVIVFIPNFDLDLSIQDQLQEKIDEAWEEVKYKKIGSTRVILEKDKKYLKELLDERNKLAEENRHLKWEIEKAHDPLSFPRIRGYGRKTMDNRRCSFEGYPE